VKENGEEEKLYYPVKKLPKVECDSESEIPETISSILNEFYILH
jgi:hypothetical protein